MIGTNKTSSLTRTEVFLTGVYSLAKTLLHTRMRVKDAFPQTCRESFVLPPVDTPPAYVTVPASLKTFLEEMIIF